MQRFCRRFWLVFPILGFTAPTQAEILNVQAAATDLSGLVQAVHLEMVDEVTDGCWTNAREIRTNARELLEGAGIAVAAVDLVDSALHPALIISGSGQRVDDSYCIVQIEVRVSFIDASRFAEANEDADVLIINFNAINTMFRVNVAVVSNENVDAETAEWVDQAIAAFAADVEAKRDLQAIVAIRERLGQRH